MSQIYLAPMPVGRPKPYQIKKEHADYIDRHHQFLRPGTMAKDLGISVVSVLAYCTEKRYEAAKYDRKIPEKKKAGLFDIDDYSKNGIF